MKNSKRTLLKLAVVAAAVCTASSVVFADPAPTDKHHEDAQRKEDARPSDNKARPDESKDKSDKTINKDVDVHKNVTYTHDDKGWYDENHTRHDYETNQGHRGYWNYENGQRVWISVDVPFVHINL